jgi:shikimate dehydrogenase
MQNAEYFLNAECRMQNAELRNNKIVETETPRADEIPLRGGGARSDGVIERDGEIEAVTAQIEREKRNIVLIGMPGSGKSSVGRTLAKRLGRAFIDTDAEVERAEGLFIPTIFERSGEAYFRECEKRMIAEIGKKCGLVIATGGGALLNHANYESLKQNGVLVYLKRDLSLLTRTGRPLSAKFTAEELYLVRKPIYEACADITVENNAGINEVAETIERLF